MKQNRKGVWTPDDDEHFERHGLGGYQRSNIGKAIEATSNKRVAVDIGAHIGHMSFTLAQHFDKVVAFEPEPENAKCFLKNFEDRPEKEKIIFHPVAIGDEKGFGSITTPEKTNSGAWEIVEDRDGSITVDRLDDYSFEYLDFIKLDCQGCEGKALRGAERLIEHFSPTIYVEVMGTPKRATKKQLNNSLLEYIESLGYEKLYRTTKDYCFLKKHR